MNETSRFSYARFISAQEGGLSPWKNGKGLTRQLAIEPADATLEANSFLWRVSQAKVGEDCEFSRFPGFDRLLAIVRGREVVLHVNGDQEMAALRVGDSFAFSGDDLVTAKLSGGPVEDLGIIYRRAKVQARMSLVPFQNKPRSFQLGAKAVFLYCLQGKFAASAYPGELNFSLSPGDALRLDEVERAERLVLLEPKAEHSTILALEIEW